MSGNLFILTLLVPSRFHSSVNIHLRIKIIYTRKTTFWKFYFSLAYLQRLQNGWRDDDGKWAIVGVWPIVYQHNFLNRIRCWWRVGSVVTKTYVVYNYWGYKKCSISFSNRFATSLSGRHLPKASRSKSWVSIADSKSDFDILPSLSPSWSKHLVTIKTQWEVTISFIDISTSSRRASSLSSSEGNLVNVFRRSRNSSSRVINPLPFKSYVRKTTKTKFISGLLKLVVFEGTSQCANSCSANCWNLHLSWSSRFPLRKIEKLWIKSSSEMTPSLSLMSLTYGVLRPGISFRPVGRSLRVNGCPWYSDKADPDQKHCSFVRSYLHQWFQMNRKSDLLSDHGPWFMALIELIW